MRLRNKTLVCILILCGIIPFATAQKVLLVKADPICANQYEYLVNGLSASDKHTSYHVQQNPTDKVILNTAQANLQQVIAEQEHKIVNVCDVNFTPELIQSINSDKKRIYIVHKKEGVYIAQKVSSGIYVEENNNYVRYSGPYYSFTYNKTMIYDPAERLPHGNSANKQAQFLANSKATMGCYKTINLIKVINETHPKQSFSMIANDDFQKMTSDQILETCQKPLNIELAEGIGIIQEKTVNCDIQLVAINGQSLGQFLTEKCDGIKPTLAAKNQLDLINNTFKGGRAIMTKPSSSRAKYFLTEPVSKMPPKAITNTPQFDFTESTTKGYNSKEEKTKQAGVYFYSSPESYQDVDIVESTQMKTKEGNINIEFNYEIEEPNLKTKGIDTSLLHKVNTGDTLYNIAQKYNTTVDRLKKLNQLENNTIYITQQLRVR